jgi:Uma2 family endonuclease
LEPPDYPWISVEDYLILDRSSREARYEYLDGQLRMLAGGSFSHSRIALNIAHLLDDQLGDGPCTAYNSDLRVRLSEDRYVYPDITVTCDEQEEDDDMIHFPRVIFEVLSPTTEMYDRGAKFAAYRACPTLEDYVLVDSQSQAVEVYHREKSRWIYTPNGPGDMVELKSLNAYLPVAAIYEKVRFK